MPTKRQKGKCRICGQRKGKRECLREENLICSRCCGETRNIEDCTRKCPYIQPLLKDLKLLPEIRRAYRSPEPGSVVLWFEHRDTSGRWDFFSPLVDLWKAGFKDCHGRRNISDSEYSLYYSQYKQQYDLIEIPWHQALYLLKSGINIRDALHLPYPDDFTRFKDFFTSLDDIQVAGSIYKCYKCEEGDLTNDVVELIIEVTLNDMINGTIGQEGENLLYFVCENCSDETKAYEPDNSNSEGNNIKTNKPLRHTILEIVKNQIKDNTPPDTKKTLNRLLKIGYARKEALNLIGGVVLTEIYDMLKVGKPYDEKKFTNALKKLK